MTRYRQGHMEKVCRGCGRVYYRQFRRNSGREGWCGGRCYMRTYRRSLGEAANGQPAGAARAGRDEPSGPLVCHQDTLEGRETVTESGEIIGFNLDLVAERPLVAQTRFAEDGSIGVDWRGRCWAWLNGDEAPALAEVVVNDAETARLLFPGQVRRVRAMVRAVETAAGRVAGLEVLTDLGWEPRTEPCAAARGLHEGGKVRILGGTVQQGLSGKVGTLLRYTSATVEVDGRRYGVGVRGLEPVSGENGPEESGETAEAAVGLD